MAYLPQRLKRFIRQTVYVLRVDDPRPALFLFWPCIWGALLGYNEHISTTNSVIRIGTLGIICLFMYSAGCIINDIIDRKIDAQIPRTATRPLAANEYSIWIALMLAGVLSILSLLLILLFNKTVIILALISGTMILIYPLTKRFTHQAQLFLGLTANTGVLVGYAAFNGYFSTAATLVYLAGASWTQIYDSLYASQDVEYDIKLGLKSTPVLHKGKLKFFLKSKVWQIAGYLIIAGLIEGQHGNHWYNFIIGSKHMGIGYFVIIAFVCALLYRHINEIDLTNNKECNRALAYNNAFVGGLITIAFILGRLTI